MPAVGRAPTVQMKSEIVLAGDQALQEKIMAVVDAEPARTKSAAMCSQMAAANLDRLRLEDEEGGCAPLGPPFTQPTGIGWDVSTEPKNREDMIALAVKQNPVVGFWGAPLLHEDPLIAKVTVSQLTVAPSSSQTRSTLSATTPPRRPSAGSATPRSSTAASPWPASSATSSTPRASRGASP